MNSLICINNKFLSISPKDLVNYINKSKYTKGIAVYFDFENEEEKKYLDDLVVEIKDNNLIFQVHGEIKYDLDKQSRYIKLLEEYSNYLGYPIALTLHPIYNKDKDKSINDTLNYISNFINNDKVIICLENLNNRENKIRLHLNDIVNLGIPITYDMGHELIDSGKIPECPIKKIRNVHIHTNRDGLDHIPIYKDDKYLDEIIKGLRFLKDNNYKYSVVYEYGIEYCVGNTLDEKVINYLNSIDYVTSLIEDYDKME